MGNHDDSNIEEIEEDASLGQATDKGLLSIFKLSSPTPEIDVCDNVHPPSFDEELIYPIKN